MFKFIFDNKLSLSLLFLLILSLLLNIRLFSERIEAFRKLNNLSLEPVNINYFPRETKEALESNKPKVVFLGDSRAAAWTNPNLDSFQFINRGVNGETSAQTILRYDAHVSYLAPDIIILQVGVNDLRMITDPPKTRQDIIHNVQNNLKKIIEKSQKIEATVIVTTIFPLGQGNIPLHLKWIWPEVNDIAQGIDEVNNYIRSLEKQPNVIVFDAYQVLEKQGKVQNIYARDLLHLNSRGYEQLNYQIKIILENLPNYN